MAILNSHLFWWYMVHTGTVLANGYFRYKPNYVKPFPLPSIPIEISQKLDELVDQIVEQKAKPKNKAIENLEIKIDNIVFKLYGLSPSEIKFITLFK